MLKLRSIARTLRGHISSLLLDKTCADPRGAQLDVLLNLVRRNAETSFGRVYGFRGIRTESDFRRHVPISEYEDLRPFINRIIAGERRVLTAEEPLMMTMTSGTTDEPKYIPVTRASQRETASLMCQWLARAEREHPKLLDHASVGIVGRAIEGRMPQGLVYGSASGLIYKNIPWLVRRAYAVPYEVAELDDYDERYFAVARFALARRVSLIATPNPATLLRLAEVISENEQQLVRALHDGTLGLHWSKQPEVCRQLAAQLAPNPARARELESIITRRGALMLGDCWPDLQLIGCWMGGSAGTRVGRVRAHFGATPLRDLGYMASEGRVTVPCEDETPAGLLALPSNYYEFIPEEEADSAQPGVLSSHELEEGRRYSILLTTAGGLYRYRINDIVQVTGRKGGAPLLSFLRKGGEMTDITGEKMHVNHFIEAITEAASRFHLSLEQFRVAPVMEHARYDIYLELEGDPSRAHLRDEVLPFLDRALSRINIEYDQKRRSRRLGAPCIHLMTRGWALRSMRRHISAGRRDTQYKWQILCPEPRGEDRREIVATVEMQAGIEASASRAA